MSSDDKMMTVFFVCLLALAGIGVVCLTVVECVKAGNPTPVTIAK